MKANAKEPKIKEENAFLEIAGRYMPLVESSVSHFVKRGAGEEDDLYQEALIALLGAYRSFDREQQQVSFGLYAKICIRNRFLSILRKRKGETECEPYADELTVADEVSPEENYLSKEGYLSLIAEMERMLSDLERRVFSLYLQDLSYACIAEKLGITEKAADNAICRIKSKLKKAIATV